MIFFWKCLIARIDRTKDSAAADCFGLSFMQGHIFKSLSIWLLYLFIKSNNG